MLDILFKKVGQPKNITDAIQFLLSENSSWITGQVLNIDGGLSSIKKNRYVSFIWRTKYLLSFFCLILFGFCFKQLLNSNIYFDSERIINELNLTIKILIFLMIII